MEVKTKGVLGNMDLVATLKQQHKVLTEKLGVINSLYTKPTANVGKDLHEKMRDLKQMLLAHVKLEDDQFYPTLESKLAGKALATQVEQSLVDLHKLTGEAGAFLDRYSNLEDSSLARIEFIRDFKQLLGKVTARIKMEEETIYPLY